MTSSFVYTANGVTWLGESLPGFVSRDYALEPIDLSSAYQSKDSIWVFSTTAYSSELICAPVILNQSLFEGSRPFYGFQDPDNEDCYVEYGDLTLTSSCDHDDPYLLHYFLFSTDLVSLRCLASAPTALAIWAKLRNSTYTSGLLEPFEISASFCRASYYSQPVVASVASLNFTVSS